MLYVYHNNEVHVCGYDILSDIFVKSGMFVEPGTFVKPVIFVSLTYIESISSLTGLLKCAYKRKKYKTKQFTTLNND